MAYLGKYIRQILSKQEAVILPGFGSLVISQGGGPAVKGRIDPPGVVIRFDAEHPKDDGKLAGEYAAGENIESAEAGQQVLELIDAIKFKLDKGEKYDLDLVGTFSRDDDNRVHFIKDPNWIIDPELFGLPSIELLELEEEDGQNTQEKAAQKPADEMSTPPKDSAPIQKEPVAMKKKMANRAPVNKWKIIWIVIGALIVVLILVLLIPPKNGENGINLSKEGIVLKENIVGDLQDAEESNELVTDEDGQEGASEQAGEQEGYQETVSDQEAVETQSPVETTDDYFIIAGSFAELQNATELMESLKAEGFSSEIIMTDSRLYRVSVQSYAEKQGAIDDLVRIKAHPGLGSCWVWSRK